MSKFDELARLKELEANVSGDQWDSIGESISTSNMVDIDGEGDRYIDIPYDEHDAEFIAAFRNAAPWLLQIAKAFKPGTGEVLRIAIILLVASGASEDCIVIDCLRRLQAAAEEMER